MLFNITLYLIDSFFSEEKKIRLSNCILDSMDDYDNSFNRETMFHDLSIEHVVDLNIKKYNFDKEKEEDQWIADFIQVCMREYWNDIQYFTDIYTNRS